MEGPGTEPQLRTARIVKRRIFRALNIIKGNNYEVKEPEIGQGGVYAPALRAYDLASAGRSRPRKETLETWEQLETDMFQLRTFE
jgi:hypothetical protein